jgi:isoleucyl-tRNA synthetase
MQENPYKNFKVGDYSAENYAPENIDLYRPYVYNIILVSPSGSMPFAQVHYPFETK